MALFWIILSLSANNDIRIFNYCMIRRVCMLKGLKNFFIYKKPSEYGFRFPEDPEESEQWDNYRGITGNSQNQDKSDSSQKESRQDNQKNQDDNEGSNNTQNKEEQKEPKEEQQGQKKQSKDDKPEQKEQNDKNPRKCDDEENDKKKETKSDKQEQVRVIKPIFVEELVKNKNIEGKDKDNKKNKKKLQVSDKEDKKKKDESSSKNSDSESKENQTKQKCQESKKDEGKDDEGSENNSSEEKENDINISCKIDENIKTLKNIFNMPVNQDVIIREFKVARKIEACLVFIDGMIDKSIVIQFTLPQLMDACALDGFEDGCPIDFLEKNILSIHQVVRMDNFKSIVPQILSGLTVVFIDGCDECLVMESRGYEKRDISVPNTETVVNGAQEGFTENLRTNITLIRRIVKNEALVTEFKIISKTNNVLAALLYMEDITNKKIVEEVKRRVDNLDIDYISGSGMLEQLVEDKSLMLFPQVISTERPDRVASFLMDGKVALVCEGTPFALAMPITFFDLFHTSEDSNLRWQYGTFLRIVRLIGTLIALLLPGIWTALILFHQEMIPTSLLSSIVISRAPVPFPFIVEYLLMELSFELIREGGIRVPGITGNALGIIGALILGQSAVSAGLVSPSLIIIVAVTGLGNFAIPNYSLALAVRIARFILIGFGAIGGLYGVSVGFSIFCALSLSMKSFGVPFFTSIAPATKSNRDKIIRGPLHKQYQRPDYLNTQNEKRMGDNPIGWVTSKPGGGRGNDQGR